MNKRAYLILLLSLLVVVFTLLCVPAIPQDSLYHNFADQRVLLGIPNFYNVLTSVPYLVFGLMGVHLLLTESRLAVISSLKSAYVIFFIGVILVGLGSGFYHLAPSNDRLLWDRLAMSISFMALLTVIIAEYIHAQLARRLMIPLLLTGLVSVLYWYISESNQQGDLRAYILVQFLPLLFIPLILWLYAPHFSSSVYFWLMIICYLLAKVFELADQILFDWLQVISGHSLKHIISSVSVYIFYRAVKYRQPVTISH